MLLGTVEPHLTNCMYVIVAERDGLSFKTVLGVQHLFRYFVDFDGSGYTDYVTAVLTPSEYRLLELMCREAR